MKDLVKPNNLENDYQRVEQFCEIYDNSCNVHRARACREDKGYSIEGFDDILF